MPYFWWLLAVKNARFGSSRFCLKLKLNRARSRFCLKLKLNRARREKEKRMEKLLIAAQGTFICYLEKPDIAAPTTAT
jgi:hypothetical protein